MPRYKLTVEYDGSPYAGWQRQAGDRSVQGVIEDAVQRLTGEAAAVHGAGRTDAGVHARGQTAHVNLSRAWDGGKLRDALNAHLRPEPVAVLTADPVPDSFDARFSAIRRHYLYRIVNRRASLALEAGRAWHVARPLYAVAMHRAAQAAIGTHDFTTFRAAECQAKSPVKTLDRLHVFRAGDVITIEAVARSFLHNQIRSLAGSLKLVGEGKWSVDDFVEALQARDRRACGPVAPPHGLYLMKVDYAARQTSDQPNTGMEMIAANRIEP
jgi:tRNA pseudouridine38-40 synthase